MKTDRKIVECGYDKKACMIEGTAVTARITSNKQSFNPLGCELSVPIPLMFQHDLKLGPVGEVVYMKKTETEVFIRATLFEDEAGHAVWQLIKAKASELTGLSVGLGCGRGQFQILENDGIDYFTKFKISEVSVCFEPSNRDCTFRIYPGGAQKMIHPTVARAREIAAKRYPWETGDRRKGRPLSEAEKLARMHPVSRELLLDLRRRGLTRKG